MIPKARNVRNAPLTLKTNGYLEILTRRVMTETEAVVTMNGGMSIPSAMPTGLAEISTQDRPQKGSITRPATQLSCYRNCSIQLVVSKTKPAALSLIHALYVHESF